MAGDWLSEIHTVLLAKRLAKKKKKKKRWRKCKAKLNEERERSSAAPSDGTLLAGPLIGRLSINLEPETERKRSHRRHKKAKCDGKQTAEMARGASEVKEAREERSGDDALSRWAKAWGLLGWRLRLAFPPVDAMGANQQFPWTAPGTLGLIVRPPPLPGWLCPEEAEEAIHPWSFCAGLAEMGSQPSRAKQSTVLPHPLHWSIAGREPIKVTKQ